MENVSNVLASPNENPKVTTTEAPAANKIKNFKIPKKITSKTQSNTNTVANTPAKTSETEDTSIPFGRLKMKHLTHVALDKDIKNIVENQSALTLYDFMYTEPQDISAFKKKFTNLIHFEEAVASKELHKYFIGSVTLSLMSDKKQTFKLESNYDLSNWIRAFKEKKLICLN